MRNSKTRITMMITALHSGQLPPSSVTRRAQFSQNLACPQGTKAKPSIGDNKHNTVMVCLQQLALLAPTLRPTRWQQSVSTARRRRNFRRVGWAVARRCERQRRGSQMKAFLPLKERTKNIDRLRAVSIFIRLYKVTINANALTYIINSRLFRPTVVYCSQHTLMISVGIYRGPYKRPCST